KAVEEPAAEEPKAVEEPKAAEKPAAEEPKAETPKAAGKKAPAAELKEAEKKPAEDKEDLVGAPKVGKVEMYRLYNKNTGEHFYTGNLVERDNLSYLGWTYEGVGWIAPSTSKTPVYRLYNKNAGDHIYTTSAVERDTLVGAGWTYEMIAWYSADGGINPVYRQYNPNAQTGTHNFTIDGNEDKSLGNAGWKREGIGWYAMELFDGIIRNPITKKDGCDWSAVFDYKYYLKNNADVKAAAGGNPNLDAVALNHFVNSGTKEQRQGNASFDEKSYRYANPDLRQAFKSDFQAYYRHYCEKGKNEGRTTRGVSHMQKPTTVYKGIDLSDIYDYDYFLEHQLHISHQLGTDNDTELIEYFAEQGMKLNMAAKASYSQDRYKELYDLVHPDPIKQRAQGYSSPTGWLILVDKSRFTTKIFRGSQGNWETVYEIEVGVGKTETETVEGVFSLGTKQLYFDSWGDGYQIRLWYATQIYGGYLFHSTVYAPEDGPYHLWDDRVGIKISHGCVRMHIQDAKWIYDNVPGGTTIVVYS
ncbi:MAG: L,D-transpeptidase family protein, partial [Eubacteriales bacterium]|nr:L,D-transpeptidase family protein [Eubacteriales bacterium]